MRKILIIEDDNLIAELERDYLEASDFSVSIENDGKKGLETLINGNYDALILDIMLPSLNGFEIAREIRKTSLIPIIMVTAKREEIDMVRGFGIGIDDYVLKPFSPRELVARVKAHLKRTTSNNENYTYKNLIVDYKGRKVTINGKEVNLTPKEYELLTYFIKNKGIALSREQLLNNVWDYDYYGDDRTVDTHIKMLRKNLGIYRDLIKTVREVGYKYETEE